MFPTLFFYFLVPLYAVIVMTHLLAIRLRDLTRSKQVYALSFALVVALIDLFFFSRQGTSFVTIFYVFLLPILLLVGCYPLTTYRGFKLLFILLTAIISVGPIIQVPFLLAKLQIPFELGIYISQFAVYPLMLIFLYRGVTPPLRYVLDNKHSGWKLFCILPGTTYVLNYLISICDVSPIDANFYEFTKFAVLLTSYIAYAIILLFFKQSREQILLENKNKLVQLQAAQSIQELAALRDTHEQAAIYRHDLRHHLQYIDTCITTGKTDAAKQYILATCAAIEESSPVRYCENDTLNMILASYISRAEQAHIQCIIQTNVDDLLPISATDLCSLIANGTENAIHACMEITPSQNRWLKLKIHKKNNKLFIEIANSCLDTIPLEEGIPTLPLEKSSLGIKSILSVVAKYRGAYLFESDKDTFSFKAVL